VAWVVIAAAVVLIVLVGTARPAAAPKRDPTAGDAMLGVQARLMLAGRSMGGKPPRLLDEQHSEALAPTPGLAWRLAAYEAAAARDQHYNDTVLLPLMEAHDDAVAALGGDAVLLHDAVKNALRQPDSLDPAAEALIEQELDWFGRALLSYRSPPTDPRRLAVEAEAQRVLFVLFAAFAAAGFALLTGVLIWCVLIVSLALRGPTVRLTAPSPVAPPAIYLEAVALYLGLYILLGVVGMALGAVQAAVLLGAVMMSAASICGILWPMWRSGDADAARRDLGLTAGRGVFAEIGAGIIGYLACLPILLAGIIGTLLLMVIYAAVSQLLGAPVDELPTAPHPVLEWVAHGSSVTRLGVLLLAAGLAPLFEEIMFRGAMLNGVTRRLGVTGGMFLMAFIFAVIHPQGLLAVPALMSIAIGLALLRMWRGGCLIAPMTAHAIHNGAIVLLLILIV
jgi:membrane protease YdiL (CAAX protease family)